MEKFEFKSWKSLAILTVICLVFIVFVIQAFQYIPQETTTVENLVSSREDETVLVENSEVRHEDQAEAEEVGKKDSESIYSYESPEIVADRTLDEYTNDAPRKMENDKLTTPPREESFKIKENVEPLEPLIDPSIEKREKYHQAEFRAHELIRESNYAGAIEQFMLALEYAETDYDKVNIYDKLALLYGVTKQYKKAIPYAQKAYQIEQTGKREIILTKLYYKSGEVEKATKRINLIMQRDFVLD